MGRLTFFLSGENPTLPSAEVLASLEAEGYDYDLLEELDQVLTLRSDGDPLVLSRRLAMCHQIGEHFCTSNSEELLDSIGSSDIIDFIPQSESIAVRVKRIKQNLLGIDTGELAEKVADVVLDEVDYEIDLDNPESEILVLLTEDKCVLSVVKAKIERSSFVDREPPKRAVVHPSTMQPVFARALVNLARTPRDGIFLDPFCGVGGILLEAGLLGARPVGVDIDSGLVEGAEENLREAGIKDFELRVGDARGLEMNEVDAIATDPPFGRQASTGGSELEELYEEVLPILTNILKSGRFICITSPESLDLRPIAENFSLELKERHKQRVHKDLTRIIYVFKNT